MRFNLIILLFSIGVQGLSQTIIDLELEHGVYYVPCNVNGLPLRFVFDTGAADVMLSVTEASFMLKNGYLKETDFIGKSVYQVANGELAEGYTLILRSIEIGDKRLTNVKASIVLSENAPLLLGQSALNKLGAIQFDYADNTLTIGSVATTRQASNTSVDNPGGNRRLADSDIEYGYKGDMVNGKREGVGTLRNPDGSQYSGDWKNGYRHGYGTMIFSAGSTYTGQWVNDMRHGFGTLIMASGSKAVGEWQFDKLNGRATLTLAGGWKYIGEWKDDKFHGQGSYTGPNGQEQKGRWAYGEFIGQ